MPPRGRRPAENPRRNAIHIRLTDDDLTVAEQAAAKVGKPVSEYARDALVAKAKRQK